MALLFCHDNPDTLELDAQVLDARPGAVLLLRASLLPAAAANCRTMALSAGRMAKRQ
jgi:hypothetical protein